MFREVNTRDDAKRGPSLNGRRNTLLATTRILPRTCAKAVRCGAATFRTGEFMRHRKCSFLLMNFGFTCEESATTGRESLSSATERSPGSPVSSLGTRTTPGRGSWRYPRDETWTAVNGCWCTWYGFRGQPGNTEGITPRGRSGRGW